MIKKSYPLNIIVKNDSTFGSVSRPDIFEFVKEDGSSCVIDEANGVVLVMASQAQHDNLVSRGFLANG